MIDDCGWSLYAVDSVRNRDVMLERESLCTLLSGTIAALNALKELLELDEGGRLIRLPVPEKSLRETMYRNGMRLHCTLDGGTYIELTDKQGDYQAAVCHSAEESK